LSHGQYKILKWFKIHDRNRYKKIFRPILKIVNNNIPDVIIKEILEFGTSGINLDVVDEKVKKLLLV
jgi:hypothetical protein